MKTTSETELTATRKGFLSRLLSSNYANRYTILAIDLLLSLLGSAVALGVFGLLTGLTKHSPSIYEVVLGAHVLPMWLVYLVWALVVSAAAFFLTATYRLVVRHSSAYSFYKVGIAVVLKELLMLLMLTVYYHPFALPMVLLVDFIATLLLLFLLRIIVIAVYRRITGHSLPYRRTALIFGLDAQTSLLRATIESSPFYRASVVGVVSTGSQAGSGVQLDKVRIVSPKSPEELKELVRKRKVTLCFFTGRAVFNENPQYVEALLQCKVSCYVEESMKQISATGELPSATIRPIKIEDLLGRDQIFLNMEPIRSELKDKVIMVTGCSGSIGSEILRQLSGLGVKLIVAFDNAETPTHNLRLEMQEKFPHQAIEYIIGDVRSLERLDYVMRRFRPNLLFHAAAYKHVPLMEENPCEAVTVNVEGTYHVALKCLEYHVERMVMISTDKAVDPSNVMGATKRACEKVIQSLDYALKNGQIEAFPTQFATTRFGNVLGSTGSVIPLFRQQIQNGGPITVTHPDIVRYFMTIPEACQLVLEAGSMSKGGEIFVFDMGEPMKIVNLARRMIELAGLVPDRDIKIEFVGLRPGEKLREVRLKTEETNLPTLHPKITMARTRYVNYQEVQEFLPALFKKAAEVDIEGTVALLKQFVPEFKSQNSRFEKFDVDTPAQQA